MKFIPILFSTEMVQAILDSRKTMTRRTLKVQPYKDLDYLGWELPNYKRIAFGKNTKIESFHKCPYGQVGDVLWVRETFNSDYSFKNSKGKPVAPGILYKATTENLPSKSDKWKPSLFMPKEACRIFLKIKNIRVERLNDITDNDSISEGIQEFTKDNTVLKYGLDGWNWSEMPRKAKDGFLKLWESINGKESLNSNPWVWVIEFERIDKPENFI
jgi:hypothetical protein